MRKILLAILASIAIVLGCTAPAHAATATFTFDTDGTTLPLAAAAADWSKNTDIAAVVGECTTGNKCVHFKVIPKGTGQPCSTANVAGCAYRLGDGSCQVEVSGYYLSLPGTENLAKLVTTHEAGHCIWSAGGKAMSFHLSDPNALMYHETEIRPSRHDANLTSVDRSFTRTLF